MKPPRLDRLLAMQKLIFDFRAIKRVIYLPGEDTERENDVDHSYGLAMIAWYLASHFPELDTDKAMRLAMVHDLVEIHAGDTYLYADESILATKKQREADAFEKLKLEWKDFPELLDAIEEYETHKTPEAKFVYALDKIVPILVIYLGEGYTWRSEEITLEMLHTKKEHVVNVSPEIKAYYDQLYALLQKHADHFHSPGQQR